MIKGNRYESISLKRKEGEPFSLLLILASVLGHFIGEKICDAGWGDLVMVLKGVEVSHVARTLARLGRRVGKAFQPPTVNINLTSSFTTPPRC